MGWLLAGRNGDDDEIAPYPVLERYSFGGGSEDSGVCFTVFLKSFMIPQIECLSDLIDYPRESSVY